MRAAAKGRYSRAQLSSHHAASEAKAFGHEPERASSRGTPLAVARGARARLAVGAALRSGRAKHMLVSRQADNAKSLCFQGRCLEDAREDVHFAASSWKT